MHIKLVRKWHEIDTARIGGEKGRANATDTTPQKWFTDSQINRIF